MTKATRLYCGNDDYGRSIEVAQSADGNWFCRRYGFNGYGNAWGKWQSCSAPDFPKRIPVPADMGGDMAFWEVPEEDREKMVEWGFGVLKIIPGPHAVRLP